MKNIIQLFLVLCYFILVYNGDSHAQELNLSTPKNQLELQHDNDFVLLSDRYYSTGLFVTYRRRLNRGIFSKVNEQLSLQFQQLAYTPDDIDAIDINLMDRPYAGFSGLQAAWSFAQRHWLLEPRFLVGLTGPSSGAGSFQRWFHRNATHVSEPSWVGEIEDSFHTNFYLRMIAELQLAPNPFGVHLAVRPTIAYGTKDIYVEPELIFFFGRRSGLEQSIAYNQLGSVEKEIYFTIRWATRFVSHDASLEGNLNGDNSVFTIEPGKRWSTFGIDLNHRSGKNEYRVGFNALSARAPELKKHKYLTLAYARSF